MNEGPVVPDASPLIALFQIDQLTLLPSLFAQVLIPPAVARETERSVGVRPWMTIRSITHVPDLLTLPASLDAGEREAIVLAREIGARWVILDDRDARKHAHRLGVPVIGTIGLLLAAKRRGLLSAVRPHIDALIRHDFFVGTSVIADALRDAGETI